MAGSRSWRVLALPVPLVLGAGLLVAGFTQRAQTGSTAITHTYATASPQCVISDPKTSAISGMAIRNDGTWVVNDRGAVLYRLDSECKVTEEVDLSPQLKDLDVKVTDIEDLAGADGWLWLADTGGNTAPRDSVQLIGWHDGATPLRIVELTYPEGTNDVEAVAIDLVGRAVLVTKESSGSPARVFRTPVPLGADPAQLLELVGEVEFEKVEGSKSGSRQATGAAVAPSGTRVALRTYAHAWEFDAPDGDIGAAIVRGNPRYVPLLDSEQGEAIAYGADGRTFLATGEKLPVALDRTLIERTTQ